MDLTSPTYIKKLFSDKEIQASKGLGQNFLVDKNVLDKIVEAADLKEHDIILEIGPGIGTLTQELAKLAGKVIAVEKDIKMCEILKETLKDSKTVEIIAGDVLRSKEIETKLANTDYKVVANLPYYITSPAIRKFLEIDNPPKEMVLMVQKEVAQRICAKPPKMNLLAVSVQFYAKPEIISYVPKNSFWPEPKVDSAIIKIKISPRPDVDRGLFFRILKTGFLQPRKQLINNFSNGLKVEKEQIRSWLSKNNIEPTQRAETLSIKDWLNLTGNYAHVCNC